MSIFTALAAKWRPPPKTTFETLLRRMSSTKSPSSSSASSLSSAASSSSSSASPRRSEKRVIQNPIGHKEVLQSYLADAVRESAKRTCLSFWKRYQSFCSSKIISLSAADSIALFLISLAESSKSKSSALIAKTVQP